MLGWGQAQVSEYQDCSILPVDEEIAWDQAIFRSAAERISEACDYPAWKRDELMRTLESNFNSAIEAGKNFDEAVSELEELVANATNRSQSGISV